MSCDQKKWYRYSRYSYRYGIRRGLTSTSLNLWGEALHWRLCGWRTNREAYASFWGGTKRFHNHIIHIHAPYLVKNSLISDVEIVVCHARRLLLSFFKIYNQPTISLKCKPCDTLYILMPLTYGIPTWIKLRRCWEEIIAKIVTLFASIISSIMWN